MYNLSVVTHMAFGAVIDLDKVVVLDAPVVCEETQIHAHPTTAEIGPFN